MELVLECIKIGIDLLKYVGTDILLPILVSILTVHIQSRIIGKKEIQNQTPDLHVICIDNRQKYNVNYDIIKKHGKFFWFESNISRIDENAQPEKTTTFTIMERVSKITDKQKEHGKICVLMFQDVTKPFRINCFLDKQGNMVNISGNDVPAYLGSDEEWCFVCPAAIVPAAIFGEVKGKNIRFKIDEDFGVLKKVIVQKRKSKRKGKSRRTGK